MVVDAGIARQSSIVPAASLREQAFGLRPVHIPFLPEALRDVPRGPSREHDPKHAEKLADYRRWHKGVAEHRKDVLKELARGNRQLEVGTLFACRDDPLYFQCLFADIYEPRKSVHDRTGSWTPFIPFPKQAQLIRRAQWMMEQDGRDADLLLSKSRDVGATWECCVLAVWMYLFWDPGLVKLVSRNEDEVEKAYDLRSMMVRIRRLLERIQAKAPFLLPRGWSHDKLHRELLYFREDNDNNIHGEATSAGTTGRGGRATLCIIDESAVIKGFLEIWATLANTTDHRIALSTENTLVDEGFYFLTHHPDTLPIVFTMDWWEDPRHDRHWFQQMRERYLPDESRFLREVCREALAGSDFVYPTARDLPVIERPYPTGSGFPIQVSIDPGQNDDTCLHWLFWDPGLEKYVLLETYVNSHQPPEFYAALLIGVEDPDFALTEQDKQVITWTRTLPFPDDIFGDPAGRAKTHDDDDKSTWYGRMEEYSVTRGHDLRVERWKARHPEAQSPTTLLPNGGMIPTAQPRVPRLKALAIQAKTKDDARFIQGRRMATMRMFRHLVLNDTPQVRVTKQALVEVKFEAASGTRPLASERRTYAATWRAHRAASLEYWAVNVEELMDAATVPYEPVYNSRPRRRVAMG